MLAEGRSVKEIAYALEIAPPYCISVVLRPSLEKELTRELISAGIRRSLIPERCGR
jgi:hypothetical protein